MQQKVILATTNAGKVRELANALEQYGLEVLGLDAFPNLEDVEETGSTFVENALLKARYVADATGLIAIADDSGLEVEALQGRPGVHSARYGSDWEFLPEESKDARNIRKLLHELKDIPAPQRTARFMCAMAACKPQGKECTAVGQWQGVLLDTPRGANGFGYDPIFFDQDFQRSAAELSKEEKNSRSHRGNALRALMDMWADFQQD